ncbi:MAG: hypothetical protein COC24_016790 [Alphaproteobacteria bacterium]|nr:hypothetical protein [Alphaproteobacteria bacterium]
MNQVARFPQNINATPQIQLINAEALKQIQLGDLRELTFPYLGDPNDVFAISTSSGESYMGPTTGEMLSFLPHNLARQTYEFIYMLHTGKGLWCLCRFTKKLRLQELVEVLQILKQLLVSNLLQDI